MKRQTEKCARLGRCFAVLSTVSLVGIAPLACGGRLAAERGAAEEIPRRAAHSAIVPEKAQRVVLTVVGTSDWHGKIDSLPLFAGYVERLRELRRTDGGGVVLIDAGDMMTGELVSSAFEGAPLIAGYNAIGYDAAALGNHEFDFGPAGDLAYPKKPGDDPLGALKARALEAKFPLLAANILERRSKQLLSFPNLRPSVRKDVAGILVGIVGASTRSTLQDIFAKNVALLEMAPAADAIAAYARQLRRDGAQVVIAAVHAGAECERFAVQGDRFSCDDGEIVQIAKALPAGLVDVIVAGHTHQGMARVVNGIAVVESFAHGQAFGRVDLAVEKTSGRVVRVDVQPPRELCPGEQAGEPCGEAMYEGAAVRPVEEVTAVLAPWLEKARPLAERRLGARAAARFEADRNKENPLGNLIADLMREARPEADLAVMNGGGVQGDLPVGDITYGALFAVFPFQNRFAWIEMSGAETERFLKGLYGRTKAFASISGMRVRFACEGRTLKVSLERLNGDKVQPEERLKLLTSDYLALSSSRFLNALPGGAQRVVLEDDPAIRDALAEALQKRGAALRPDDKALFDPQALRVALPGELPARCRQATDD